MQNIVLINNSRTAWSTKIINVIFEFSKQFASTCLLLKKNKMVREPNVSPHKQIIKDDDVKECISIE